MRRNAYRQTIVSCPCLTYSSSLAFIFVLVLPGFAMMPTVFPQFNQLETERFALSIGLSITIVVALGLMLGYSTTLIALTGGITAYSLIYSIGLATPCFLKVWAFRRANVAVVERRDAARAAVRAAVLDASTALPKSKRCARSS